MDLGWITARDTHVQSCDVNNMKHVSEYSILSSIQILGKNKSTPGISKIGQKKNSLSVDLGWITTRDTHMQNCDVNNMKHVSEYSILSSIQILSQEH